MCLGVPGRITRWINRDPLMASAEIDFGGISKQCQMACVPDAAVGEYVLVHSGVALTVLDTIAAEQLLRTLDSLHETYADEMGTE